MGTLDSLVPQAYLETSTSCSDVGLNLNTCVVKDSRTVDVSSAIEENTRDSTVAVNTGIVDTEKEKRKVVYGLARLCLLGAEDLSPQTKNELFSWLTGSDSSLFDLSQLQGGFSR